MIYTVTLNPSLDYIVSVEHFKLGLTNRTGFEQILPGGKGINVSIVLRISELPVRHWDLRQALQGMKLSVNWKIPEFHRSLSGWRKAFQELM